MNRMKVGSALVLGLFGLLSGSVARGQVTKEQLDDVRAKLQAPETLFNNLSNEHRKVLSGGALNFFHVIKQWPEIERGVLARQASLDASQWPEIERGMLAQQASLGASSLPDQSLASELALIEAPITPGGPFPVSNPANDSLYGPAGGNTQSETSTAWCGKNVVAGFNDSESYYDSGFATGFAHLSFDGFGYSTNKGMSYADQGYVPSKIAGDLFDFLEGDPAVVCGSQTNFYYGSLDFRQDASSMFWSAITVSPSTNGGVSFNAPIVAVQKSALTHFLDKVSLAVNHNNPNHLVVGYTDFDGSFTACPSTFGVAVEVVESSDGGATWTSPFLIFRICSNTFAVQGSQVAFSPNGAVDVALEGFFSIKQLGFVQAAFGAAFPAVKPVANVFGVGDGFSLQDGFRTFLDIQQIAVDNSAASTKGNIYLAYHDSKFQKTFNGVIYAYADAIIVKSTNNGASWSAPVQVNTNPEPLSSGLGTDSYQPGVAVDQTGAVAVCWYDRRNDPHNNLIDRYCGVSHDAAATFTNVRKTSTSFPPAHGMDDIVNPAYMGDYDWMAVDGLKMTSGFISAFQVVRGAGPGSFVPNADVWAVNFN
jgi:hypothetical protein